MPIIRHTDKKIKGENKNMISYAPLWDTMKSKSATTYTLRSKGGISGSTVLRLQANDSVSTTTLDALCKILDCSLNDVVIYVPDGN